MSTFTFICHPGKTHNHRSRGDTPWRAQTMSPCPIQGDVCLVPLSNANVTERGPFRGWCAVGVFIAIICSTRAGVRSRTVSRTLSLTYVLRESAAPGSDPRRVFALNRATSGAPTQLTSRHRPWGPRLSSGGSPLTDPWLREPPLTPPCNAQASRRPASRKRLARSQGSCRARAACRRS